MIEIIKTVALLCTLNTGVASDNTNREWVEILLTDQLDLQRKCHRKILGCFADMTLTNLKKGVNTKEAREMALLHCAVKK